MRLILLFIPLFVFGLEFKVATYNVENLFDAKKDGSEYEEYTPNNKHGWNESMLRIKIASIARVIADIDADIIALAEIENREVLEQLNKALGNRAYPYVFYPNKKERVNIETALLSRFPIEKTKTITIKDQARGIHKISLKINSKPLDVFINHWPAYLEKEDERAIYAQTLRGELEKEKEREFVLLGDLNSPYQVQRDNWGNALVNVLQAGDKNAPFYNLWYELPQDKRYSHSYGKKKTALDHIIISKTLSDGKNIDYKTSSMSLFIKPYMLDNDGNPKRWQISNKGKGVHLGEGFSDHLPVTAIFHTVAD